MIRYLPPNGTAGFAIFFVKAPKRLPCPPAKIIAKHFVFLIKIPPGAIASSGPQPSASLVKACNFYNSITQS